MEDFAFRVIRVFSCKILRARLIILELDVKFSFFNFRVSLILDPIEKFLFMRNLYLHLNYVKHKAMILFLSRLDFVVRLPKIAQLLLQTFALSSQSFAHQLAFM